MSSGAKKLPQHSSQLRMRRFICSSLGSNLRVVWIHFMLQILSTSNSFRIFSLDIYFLVCPGAHEPGLCQYTLLRADWFGSLVGIRKYTRPACNGGGWLLLCSNTCRWYCGTWAGMYNLSFFLSWIVRPFRKISYTFIKGEMVTTHYQFVSSWLAYYSF